MSTPLPPNNPIAWPHRGKVARLIAVWLAVLVVAGTTPAPGEATTSDDEAASRLQEVEQSLREERQKSRELDTRSGDLQAELARLQRARVEAAEAVRALEAEALRLEDEIADQRRLEGEKLVRLRAESNRLGDLMMAMQNLARRPPEALVVQPLSANDMVRSAVLLRTVVPQVRGGAMELRGELQAIVYHRRELDSRRDRLAANAAALARERTRLDGLFEEKDAAKKRTDKDLDTLKKRVAALSREAKDLRDLLRRLDAERLNRERAAAEARAAISLAPPKPQIETETITQRRGRLPIPAVGRVVKRYGQDDGTGLLQKGLTIETGPGTRVVAPHGGRVVYADVFRGYGQLLIIEHGEGYHTLLAGLGRMDVTIGQQIVAGEPVGVMNQSPGSKPALYVELRRDGQPINPLPWLAASMSKVSG